MKLKNIIKKIVKLQEWEKPNFKKYAQMFFPGNADTFANVLNNYLNEFFLSKHDAVDVIESIHCEIQELKEKIEDLELENESLRMSIYGDDEFDNVYGLSKEDLKFLDRMVAEEYGCNVPDQEYN